MAETSELGGTRSGCHNVYDWWRWRHRPRFHILFPTAGQREGKILTSRVCMFCLSLRASHIINLKMKISRASKFHNFKNSKLHNLNKNFRITQMQVLFFMISGTHTSKLSKCLILKFYKIACLKMLCDFFLDYGECPGVSKDEQYWFWESWVHVHQNEAE